MGHDAVSGAGSINPEDTPGISEADAWLFTVMEERWIKPCHAYLGDSLIGMCMFAPAFMVAACILLPVFIISRRQQREAVAVSAAVNTKKKA